MKRSNRQERVTDRALVALLEGELTRSERQELERALHGSADLRRRHQRLSEIRALLQRTEGQLTELDLVSGVRDRAQGRERQSGEPCARSLHFANWIRRVLASMHAFARALVCRPNRSIDD